MHGRLTTGLALLRGIGVAALLLLLWNPTSTRRLPAATPPVVLLDASLSMAGRGGHWHDAVDSARALARGAVIWRFGAGVSPFDSGPPEEGASRLAPALDAAAARGGAVAVVTDGAIDDARTIPPDLLRQPHLIVLPRASFYDAFVAAVEGPHRVSPDDTLRLKVSYGAVGGSAPGKRESSLNISAEGRRLLSRKVTLPDSGIVSTELTLPGSRLPHPGWTALEVRLDGAPDSEPRDDARLFVVELSSAPAVVVLASPPDWDLRFLAATLADVARAPLKTFVQPATRGSWLDAGTLKPIAPAAVRAALARARLVVQGGDLTSFALLPVPSTAALLVWRTHGGQEGDWYLDPPPVSPVAPALAGVRWDSLPPATALATFPADSGAIPVLSARLARRGPARALAVLVESRGPGAGPRRVEIAGAGLYRWVFRGGASAEAYRTLVAALADWLLAGTAEHETRAEPERLTVPNGLPLVWRWTGKDAPRSLVATFSSGRTERQDTLRFDAAGRSEIRLPAAVYHYALRGGSEQGVVAVELYSDEWRPRTPSLESQAGARAGDVESVSARDRWWLFALVLVAFASEWAWRRRQGLP